jgi:hypothetical protein
MNGVRILDSAFRSSLGISMATTIKKSLIVCDPCLMSDRRVFINRRPGLRLESVLV